MTVVERLRAALAGEQVREKTMFGGLSFMLEDRMLLAARPDGGLLVRIDPADSDEAKELGAAQAVMGADRSMGPSWVTVSAEHLASEEELQRVLDLALAFHRRSTAT
ncbi:MAG: hypothetical protein JWP82_2791 [Humibacillus sp.]|nr:hypothetical protein [Humibacillus sp.]